MKASYLLSGIALTACLVPQAPAFAQTGPDAAGEDEIIVTARRISEPLQKTPIAITALNSEALEAASVTNVSDITKMVPNLTLVGGRGLSGQGFVFIRGIGQTDDNPATDPGVAQYIDDVYIGRTQGTQFDFNDIGSVEVLRGPQGTLYGKNAIGGAIKINSRLPDNEPSYNVTLGYGNFNDVRIGAGISHPLVDDKLYFRISGQGHFNSGYMENSATGKKDSNAETYSARAILRATPTEAVDIWLAADISRDLSRPLNPRIVALNSTNAVYLASRAAGIDITPFVLQPGGDPNKGGGFDTALDAALGSPRSKLSVWGLSFHASVDLGGSELKSITAYRKLDSTRLSDTDAAGVRYLNSLDLLHQDQFSQEFQISGQTANERFNWLGGVYFYSENFDTNSKSNYLLAVNPNGSFDRYFAQKTKSYAAFLNLGYALTDNLRLSLGGRYTHENKDIVTDTQTLAHTLVLFPSTARTAKFNDFSPKFGIDFQASRDIFLYASAAKGFKSGGFNGRANLNQALDPVGSEKVWSYEVGLKTQWLDRRITFNIAGFYMDYKDIQEQVFVPRSDGLPGVTSVVLNAASARMKGFEIEARVRPIDGFTISGDIGYVDAAYSKPFLNLAANYTNNKLPLTSKFTGRIGARWEGAISSSAQGSLNLTYSYRSSYALDVPNTAVLVQDGYGLLDARASVELSNGVEFAVFGKNLTDKTYKMTGADFFGSLGESIAWFGAPRTYGVEVNWRF